MITPYILYVWFTLILSVDGTSLYSNDRFPVDDCCTQCSESSAHFGYNNNTCHGPARWQRITNLWRFCGLFRQSPVNIRTSCSRFRPELRKYPLKFKNLCRRIPGRIRNNGHSPHFDTYDTYNGPQIELFNVPGHIGQRFIFNELHVHLGKNRNVGSEHALDGNRFPMEVHLVFYNSIYGDAVTAKPRPGGLAVIGVMIEVGNDRQDGYFGDLRDRDCPSKHTMARRPCVCSNDYYKGYMCRTSGRCRCADDNDCAADTKCRMDDYGGKKYCGPAKGCRVRYAYNLSYLMENYYPRIRRYENVARVPEERQWVNVDERITPSDALPYDWSYYTYKGSLTTPPCYQTVQWINMRCPIRVSRQAYDALALVQDSNGDPLTRNGLDRPIQRGYYGGPEVKVFRSFTWDAVGKEARFCDVN